MIKLKKGGSTVEISTLGAELYSWRSEGRQMLWNRNPDIWDGSAMVLFPFIGRCCEDRYLLHGHSYPMGLHGFAWKKEFRILRQEDDFAELELTDDEDTLEIYPFRFRLTVSFRLSQDRLSVQFCIKNRSETEMYFALGWHPGFTLAPQSLDRHYVRFPGQSILQEKCIVPRCMLTGQTQAHVLTDEKLPLNRELFLTSARVFSNAGSHTLLVDEEGTPCVTLEHPDFPTITLWQTLGSGADFVCIEPWLGYPGDSQSPAELSKGKYRLAAGQSFRTHIQLISGCGK